MNLFSTNTDDNNAVAQMTRNEIIDSLFSQPVSMFLSHFVSMLVFAYWLSAQTDNSLILLWLGFGFSILSVRVGLSYFYQQHFRKTHVVYISRNKWLKMWMFFTVLLSINYAFIIIFGTPIENDTYVVSVAMLFTVICGGAAITYAASMAAFSLFVVPVCILSAAYLFSVGSFITNIVAFSMLVYNGLMYLLIRNVNKVFVTSIELNYQNQQEIEKRKLVEQQLYDISRRDSLTGIFNRRYFDEMLEVELGRAHRNRTVLSLALLDIDYFKEYNDHYGHVGGDKCLIDIAHTIQKLANRQGDLVARYGGEEFAIILPGVDGQGAIAFANRIQKFVQEQQKEHKKTKLPHHNTLTVSMGVTTVLPLIKITPNKLIQQADRALYKAKEDGRNCVKTYSPFGI